MATQQEKLKLEENSVWAEYGRQQFILNNAQVNIQKILEKLRKLQDEQKKLDSQPREKTTKDNKATTTNQA